MSELDNKAEALRKLRLELSQDGHIAFRQDSVMLEAILEMQGADVALEQAAKEKAETVEALVIVNELRDDEIYKLTKDKAELVEGLVLARKSIFKTCNDAVDKLNEIAPDEGWDSGFSIAETHCVGLDLLLAKHSAPGSET